MILILGVYGDDYTPCIPVALLQFPAAPLLTSKRLPDEIIQQLISFDIWNTTSGSFKNGYKAEFYVLVHPKPILSPCQKFLCENIDEVNMMYHPWLFGSTPLTEDVSVRRNLKLCLFQGSSAEFLVLRSPNSFIWDSLMQEISSQSTRYANKPPILIFLVTSSIW
jgi:hypothetical protein